MSNAVDKDKLGQMSYNMLSNVMDKDVIQYVVDNLILYTMSKVVYEDNLGEMSYGEDNLLYNVINQM